MLPKGRSALLVGYSVTLLTLSSILVVLRLVSRRLCKAKFWWESVVSSNQDLSVNQPPQVLPAD